MLKNTSVVKTADLNSVPRQSGRTLTYLILLSFAGSMVGTNAMAQKPQIALTTSDIRGVEISDSGQVPAQIGTVLSAKPLSAMLPYVVVIRNTGSLPITGLDVRYEIVTNGDKVVNNLFYGSPGDIADAASTPIVAPGKSVVISPNHLVNEMLLSSSTVSLSDRAAAAIIRKVDLYGEADQITISVDSIIRSDGVILGPDRSSRFRLFQQEIWGYTAFREDLLERLSSGNPDDEIISWLKETMDLKLVRPGKNEPLDRGVVMQKTLAERYLKLMESGQRQSCVDALEKAPPEVALKQIFKVRQEVQP